MSQLMPEKLYFSRCAYIRRKEEHYAADSFGQLKFGFMAFSFVEICNMISFYFLTNLTPLVNTTMQIINVIKED
jgi:hypothetical protein